MILIDHGTLPTASALHVAARGQGTTSHEVLRLCRALMAIGRIDETRRLLVSLGFDWRQSKAACPLCGEADDCMCVDLEAVRKAVG